MRLGPHLKPVSRPHKPCCWQVSKSNHPSKAVGLVIHISPSHLCAGVSQKCQALLHEKKGDNTTMDVNQPCSTQISTAPLLYTPNGISEKSKPLGTKERGRNKAKNCLRSYTLALALQCFRKAVFSCGNNLKLSKSTGNLNAESKVASDCCRHTFHYFPYCEQGPESWFSLT